MRVDSKLCWPLFLLSASYWRYRRQGNSHGQSLEWLRLLHGLPLALWIMALYRILMPGLRLPVLGKLPFSLFFLLCWLTGYWLVRHLSQRHPELHWQQLTPHDVTQGYITEAGYFLAAMLGPVLAMRWLMQQ